MMRLTPLGRERLVALMASGQTPQAAARAAGVCPRTARKWQARYKAEGAAGLQDRSSRPKTLRNPTPAVTDNGACYKSKAFAKACKRLKIKHIRTKPYTPKTNGKAERFIQTALREWAYARAYQTSDQRAEDLPLWSHMYNWHHPTAGIKDQTPISRLSINRDNLLRLHT